VISIVSGRCGMEGCPHDLPFVGWTS
jgi:hypothetical protein